MKAFAALSGPLLAQLAARQLSHAYIFSGSEAEEQALALAAALVCQTPGADGQACGLCPACRNMAVLTYPDVRVLDPLNGKHRTENMRDLVALAGLSPISGQRKVFILRQAETLTEDAANTLLKLLEEPAADTTLILLSDHPDALLPTVLSRCQLFLLGRGADQLEPEVPPELAEKAADLLRRLPGLPIYQTLLLSREFAKDKEQQRLFLFALLQQLHAAVCGVGGPALAPAVALRSANMLESALEMLEQNVNQHLLLDVVYLRLWQNFQAEG